MNRDSDEPTSRTADRPSSSRHSIDRRGLLKATGGLAGVSLLPALESDGTALAQRSGAAVPDRFADPDRSVQPMFRWWWPHGRVDHDEIVREVDQIADAGFGGVEIADVHHSVEESIDPEATGWGTTAWIEAVETALEAASERGVSVDLTLGPSWPPALPTVAPDDDAAAKELVHGRAFVDGGGTYSGPVPAPRTEPADGVDEQHLVGVHAARLSEDSSPDDQPVGLESASIRDLTDAVDAGTIEWTAPDDGEWVLISYRERGTGQRPERGPHTDPRSHVVDHFSRAGVDAIIDFWEANLLTPTVRDLLPDVGGAMFEDSIELELDATFWTPNLPAEFAQRMGYSIDEYLPLLVNDDDVEFTFGGDSHERARRDFWETLTQLYIENHLEPLAEWVHSVGLELRVQPYGLDSDAIAKSAVVDVPEGEALGFSNNDDFRSLAGGRDIAGDRILSEEAGAFHGGAYNTTWEDVLQSLNSHYAAGVNQAVLHGFSYADAPGAEWPGFAAFTPYDGWPGFAESWGPRQPTWDHVPDIAGYLSRVQLVTRAGTSSVDAAVLRQKGYAGTGFGAPWFTDEGLARGYTHQFLSPELLDEPTATVSNGRLAPDGPAYKVFVIEEDAFTGRNTLQVSTAERVLEFARDGLPIVIIGDAPDEVPGIADPDEDDALRAIVGELLEQPSVRRVDEESDVPDALSELGVRPDAEYEEPSSLLNLHRAGDRVDYYYLYNRSETESVEHTVSLAGNVPEGFPYRLDAWTGAIERVARYEQDGDRIDVPVTLQPGESTVIAIGRRSWYNDGTGRGLHATASDAAEVRFVDGALEVRDTEPGTYETNLSNGRVVDATIDGLPDERTLESWDLTVESWKPGESATETITETIDVTLEDGLVPWPEIDELSDASGVGTYTTSFDLGEEWTDGGAYLQLGEVFDTVRVVVNGRQVPPLDQVTPIADVGSHLEVGRNTLEVEVATTLNNRLRVSNPDVYEILPRQEYGLLGPVKLVPYGRAPVSPGRPNGSE